MPEDADALSPDWLTARLAAAGAVSRARISSVEIEDVGEHGMTGHLVRLRLSYDRPEPGAPSSLVAKFSASAPEERAIVHSFGFYEREVRFYQLLAPKIPLRTPRCYFAEVDLSTGASFLLLEDLATLQSLTWGDCSVVDAELIVCELAVLHAAWWQDPRLAHSWLQLKGMVAPDQVGPAFVNAWEPFLAKLSDPVTEEILDIGRLGRKFLPRAAAHLHADPPTRRRRSFTTTSKATICSWRLPAASRH